MRQNGLVRSPEETIKRLNCFEAESQGAGLVTMSVPVLHLAKGAGQWEPACVKTASYFNVNIGKLHWDADV